MDGNVLFDGLKETYSNGFMGFWLPRNKTYTIEFEFDGYGGIFTFSTTDESPTCLTEFELLKLDI